MLDRLPMGLRTALLAGLVALLAAGGGAWWLRQHLYADQLDAARATSVVQAHAVARALVLGKQTALVTGQLEWPYFVVAPKAGGTSGGATSGGGTFGGGLEYLSVPAAQLPPAPATATAGWTTTRTIRIGAPLDGWPRPDGIASPDKPGLLPDRSAAPGGAADAPGANGRPGAASPGPSVSRPPYPSMSPSMSQAPYPSASAPAERPPSVPARAERLAHRSFEATGVLIDIPPGETTMFGTDGGRYTVYVLVLPDQAEAAVGAVDPALAVGVPLAALLVAVTAYASTRRALRPVEAIRAELAALAESGAGRLRHRVPVPRARDEIFRLATTTNETLERLERSDREQRRFVADAAHELRSPVTALRAQLEISLTHPGRTDWPSSTENALRAARRLQDLTDDLLFLSRPDVPAQRGSLVDLAGTAEELARPGPPGLQVVVDAPSYVPVRGNALHLHRLLRNLLDNAFRHARERVTVTITITPATITPAGDEILVEVHNDGSGIAPADRERVFDRFTRLDEARTRDAGGSGLGLAIARDIARHHHGTLTIADTPPGTGTAFHLRLPAPGPPPA
ncbi:sensor histidine kinase [Streptomyces sp. NPDC051569]|uniref:sensor histidine kinase n=1 Tax=Streptomyces sp. NPDC051569 TaxID=3365661 RepID=UPI00378D2154